MVVEGTPHGLEIGWNDGSLELRVKVSDDGVTRLADLAADRQSTAIIREEAAVPSGGNLGLPLVDVITFGTGRAWSGRRYAESVVGGRLRYLSHDERMDGNWHELEVHLEDPVTRLAANVKYRVLEGSGALRSRVRLINRGVLPVTVESVTSFLGSGLAGPRGALSDVDLWWAENDWFGEGRWRTRALSDALPDLNTMAHKQDPRAGSASRMSGAGHLGRTYRWALRSTAAQGTPGYGRSRTTVPGTGKWVSTASPVRRRLTPGTGRLAPTWLSSAQRTPSTNGGSF